MGLWRVHVEIEDRPGQLGELAAAVGAAGCNIVSLTVLGERGPDGSVTDELLVDAANSKAAATLCDRIRAAGMGCNLAVPAEADELRDPVTTALALARGVVADPHAAGRAVAGLLHARLVDANDPSGYTQVLRVFGQEIQLWRAWPFTATELSRAAALVELAELCAGSMPSAASNKKSASLGLVMLGNGAEIELRTATEADRPLVAALHARCTPSTRRGRFLNPSPTLSPEELSALLGGQNGDGIGLLALTTDGGHAVGLATLAPEGNDSATLGVLVEDAWQSRGVGTALVRRALELATEAGYAQLSASAHPGNLRLTRLFRRCGVRPTAQLVDGLLRVHIALRQPVASMN